MAGAMSPSEVKSECDRLEISPSEKDSKSANVFNGRPGQMKSGSSQKESTFASAAAGVPGYGGTKKGKKRSRE